MDILDIFKDPKKVEINNQLKRLGIYKDFTVNKDYTVDLHKDVAIMAKKIDVCPVKFNVAHGNFIWHYSDLKSVINLPIEVQGNLSIVGNKIKTLIGLPTKIVGGTFNCSGNILINLNGSPRKVGSLIASGCELKSLEGSPKEVKDDYIVSKNKLTNLKESPPKIGGKFDCSSNKLTNLEFLPICKKSITGDNPIEGKDVDSDQIHIEFDKFHVDDEVTYNKSGSKFEKMVGDITNVDNSSGETLYRIHFKKLINPSLERDATVANIKGKYLEKLIAKFSVGDTAIYKNPNSKYNGYVGKIDSIAIENDEELYKLRFEYSENPGLIDIVSPTNKNKSFVNVGKIKITELKKISSGDKDKDKNENEVVKSSSNNWNVGDIAICYGDKVELLSLKSPDVWNVKPINRQSAAFSANHTILQKSEEKIKKSDTFTYGEEIVYLDPDGPYDGLRGEVTTIGWRGGSQSIDIKLIDNYGIARYVYSVKPEKLEKVKDGEKTEKVKAKEPESKFKKGDKVVYISKTTDDKNKDLHLLKGEITYLNTNFHTKKTETYDVRFPKQGNSVERTIFFIHENNLILSTDKFKVGDKVVYNNLNDDFNGQVGLINKLDKDKYNVIFNDGESTMNILGIDGSDLIKFVKPIGSEVHLNDDIIYTKPDSKYYGCQGTVISYEIDGDKPFEIEIKSKNKKLVKLKTTDENLEYVPPPRVFKKGDKIRYINENQPYDGLIGVVDKITIKNLKNPLYDVILKSLNGGTLYVTTHADHLLLLEEAADTETIKYGQKVKYINPTSKYNNRIGEYQGNRVKDGKTQYSVKFDDGSAVFKTIFFDESEGVLEPAGEAPKTTTTTTTTTYTAPKKKKKKEEEPPRPPVLVYNRRNVARKSFVKLEVGDEVKIITKFNNINDDKGVITEIPHDNEDRYIVQVGDTNFWMEKKDIKKDTSDKKDDKSSTNIKKDKKDKKESISVDEDESSKKIEIGDTVTIVKTVSNYHIGDKGKVTSSKNIDGRYEITLDSERIYKLYLLRDQFKKG